MAWFPPMEKSRFIPFCIKPQFNLYVSWYEMLDNNIKITWYKGLIEYHNSNSLNLSTLWYLYDWSVKVLTGLIHAQQSSKQCFTKQPQRLGLARNISPSKMANIYIISHNLVIWRSYTLFELYIHLSNIIP